MLTLDDLIAAARKPGPSTPAAFEVEGGSFVKTIHSDKKLDKIAKISSNLQPIQKPLPKFKSEKIKRIAAYEQVSKDLSKWLPAITSNRKAESLFLSTARPGACAPIPTSKSMFESFSPKSDLEQKMDSILSAETPNSLEDPLQGLTPDLARERQIDLQKLRSFLFFQQKKQKRSAKIKSKAYHRIKKKEREAKSAKEMSQSEPSQKALLKAEIARAKERMTQKHRHQRGTQHLSALSPEAQLAQEEQTRIQRLKSKIYLSDEEPEEHEEDSPPPASSSSLLTLKFMKKGAGPAASDSDQQDSGDGEDISDHDSQEDSDDEILLGQRSFSSVSKDKQSWKEQIKENNFTKENVKELSSKPVLLKNDSAIQFQRSLVAEAFQHDKGVISDALEFASEKLSVAANEVAKPFVDATLVGWGSWGGHGISEEKLKRKRPFLIPNPNLQDREGVDPSKRKDARLPHVIIREKRDPKQTERKYLLSRLPYPYDNEAQFNAASYLIPVGKEWNPTSTLQKKIAPRISQNLNGLVIKPLPLKRKG